MLHFSLNKTPYQFPTALADITLQKYIAFINFQNENEPRHIKEKKEVDKLTTEETMAGAEYILKSVNFWTDAPIKDLERTEYEDIFLIYQSILKAFDDPIPTIDRFKIKGMTFYFPNENLRGSSFGEFADAAFIEQANNELQHNNFTNLAKVIAIYCRLKDEAYLGGLIDKREKLFLKLTMDKVMAFTNFFLQRKILSEQVTLISSLEKQISETRKRVLMD